MDESGAAVLDVVLDKLTEFLESTKELKDHIVSAMIYPAILIVTGGLSVIILLTFVLPKFSVIFAELGSALPLPTQIVLKISETALHNAPLVVLAGVLESKNGLPPVAVKTHAISQGGVSPKLSPESVEWPASQGALEVVVQPSSVEIPLGLAATPREVDAGGDAVCIADPSATGEKRSSVYSKPRSRSRSYSRPRSAAASIPLWPRTR